MNWKYIKNINLFKFNLYNIYMIIIFNILLLLFNLFILIWNNNVLIYFHLYLIFIFLYYLKQLKFQSLYLYFLLILFFWGINVTNNKINK